MFYMNWKTDCTTFLAIRLIFLYHLEVGVGDNEKFQNYIDV